MMYSVLRFFLIIFAIQNFSENFLVFACPVSEGASKSSYVASSFESSAEFHDVSQTPELFRAQVLLTAQHPKHPDRVWIRELNEYDDIVKSGGRLFLTSDNSGGFGITHDHELISMFNNGSEKGLGKKIVAEATHLGANHLYCWGEPLVQYYQQFDFIVKETLAYRPEFWINDNPPPDPKPNLYLMELRSSPVQDNGNLAHQQILSNLSESR